MFGLQAETRLHEGETTSNLKSARLGEFVPKYCNTARHVLE